MAFGVKREELTLWKRNVENGNIAFLTHYWMDDRFPNCNTVTKVGCSNIEKLKSWGESYGLLENWIHRDEKYPHFDLFGEYQKDILQREDKWDHIERFRL
ncbi:hypothetical protein J2Z83_000043 [Virgibacillus natechei]|uniref:Uncharacterized protein n=1 Tax=Virgibacillus natechei TaxID=1216297 RepID=A0ABS4IAJ5_9BACI|nr:hypothetical protein [Virgibacillus natechei]MBP1967951.1 hypothetical protein [Virgibacillus natechei]UZD14760.1 hypothetical protein OLD84_09785 [Virgibacillus natechei]